LKSIERIDMHSRLSRTTTLAICSLFTASVFAQQYVYPAKGQSPEQQKKDEAECNQWATGQSGGPAQASAPPPPAQATTPTGVTAGAGARGAARGAVVGGIAGDAGAGAAAGAAAGRAQSRRENRNDAQQASAQQQQAQSSQNAAYAKARAACLEGRGYTVK
jgi:hypothetical protein